MYITLTVVGDTCEMNLSVTLRSRRKRLSPCRKLRPTVPGRSTTALFAGQQRPPKKGETLDAKTPWLPVQLLLSVAPRLLMQAPCRRWADMNATSVLNRDSR